MAVQRLVLGGVYRLEESAAIKIMEIINGLTEEQQKGLLDFLTVYFKN